MKKLGIYGDSFADYQMGHDDYPELDEFSWMHLLQSDYDVTCHGLRGSSIYYSYSKFLESHADYDKIIFVVTTYDRWPLAINFANRKMCFPSLVSVEYAIKNLNFFNVSAEDKQVQTKLRALHMYFKYLVHDLDKVNHTFADLMIAEIKRIRPDTIFVTFDTMWGYTEKFQENLVGVPQNLEYIAEKYYEIRCICHVSEEMNQIIYQDAKQALLSGTWVSTVPDIVEHKHPFSYYYRKT